MKKKAQIFAGAIIEFQPHCREPRHHPHLDSPVAPEMVRKSLADWDSSALDFLSVENVSTFVCSASYHFGENVRVVLMSVTESEDKPLKYPSIFHGADLAVITKLDLAEAVEFDSSTAPGNIGAVSLRCAGPLAPRKPA